MVRALLPLAGNRATYGHVGAPAVAGQPALEAIEAVWAHWGLRHDELPGDAEAGWYTVIGDPVDHSLSPRIHNAALRAASLPQRYGALAVPDSIGAVRLLATVAGRIGLHGASVTAPLKGHMAQIAQGDESVEATGAANCVRTTPGGFEATNTDAAAFRRMFGKHKGATDRIAVLGNGGAAAAALWAAQTHQIPATVVARDTARGQEVAKRFDADHVAWDDRDAVHADAWVQATPIGSGSADASPLTDAMLADTKAVVELVYAGGPTPLQRAAEDLGVPVEDGRSFLIEQAVDAFRFWTGKEADRHVMEAAL